MCKIPGNWLENNELRESICKYSRKMTQHLLDGQQVNTRCVLNMHIIANYAGWEVVVCGRLCHDFTPDSDVLQLHVHA